jgi:nucleoside-diphosphate-sugar epimerase
VERKYPSAPRILVTGAAGNLGSRLAGHLVTAGHHLRLMWHRRELPTDLTAAANVEPVRADLADSATIAPAVAGIDVVVHFAGVLFAPRPERFLAETNTRWFANLTSAALGAGVRRILLMSFPQVEGPTSVAEPASGRLAREPISAHARTRLAAERLLLDRTSGTSTTPIVLRSGMVYGRGILLVNAARWLARRRLLCVWREPTLLQLISITDFLRATEAAIIAPAARGIYHVGDERPVTVQEFLDQATRAWGYGPPRRVPFWSIVAAAAACEGVALVLRTKSPLTRDFVRLGRVPHWGDTRRARAELIPTLEVPTLEAGLATL